MGMIMQAQPVYDCYMDICKKAQSPVHLIYLTPQGKTLTREFQITNGGQSDLIIRHIGPTSSRIKAKIDKTVIRPGDAATLTVTLDSKGVTGRLGEGVTIVTNDPARPARDIRVLANIVE